MVKLFSGLRPLMLQISYQNFSDKILQSKCGAWHGVIYEPSRVDFDSFSEISDLNIEVNSKNVHQVLRQSATVGLDTEATLIL